MNAAEAKLARIRSLCDERSRDAVEADPIWPDEVRAILTDAPLPSHGADSDAEALRREVIEAMSWAEQIDMGRVSSDWAEALLDRYLALVRPVEGVTLTPEEARVLLKITARMTSAQFGRSVLSSDEADTLGDLLTRLEEASS